MKIVKLALGAALLSWPIVAPARQSSQTTDTQSSEQKKDDALAAAARRAREQKKDQPKAGKVWDNDNIPSKPDAINVLGQSTSAADNTDQNGAAATPNAAPEPAKSAEADSKERASIASELADAKEKLQSLNTDLDILARKYVLDQASYDEKPNYSSDKEGAAKLKGEQDEIDAKRQEIADAQKKIDDLTAKLIARSEDSNKPTSTPQ
jgi:hypothetical protein